MKKKTILIVAIAALVVAAAVIVMVIWLSGGSTDVVAKQAVVSFENVLAAMPESIAADAATGGWALTAPDGSARILWNTGGAYGVILQWDARPFLDAGLDVTKLPADYTVGDGTLSLGVTLGKGQTAEGATPQESFRNLVQTDPSILNFHLSLDHFGLLMGGGNLFEWASDLITNSATGEAQDKDVVFVLNPEPLIAAGADPESVAGWVYAQVDVMQNRAVVKVYKFLKPFNIEGEAAGS